jgi:hypothetical protein
MKFGWIVAALMAAVFATPALAQRDVERTYAVLEEDVRIAFPSAISGFERPADDVLLIRVGANRWYRAKLGGLCGRDAMLDQTIYFRSRGPAGIDRWSHVVIDERVCNIESLDRIENPHPIGS